MKQIAIEITQKFEAVKFLREGEPYLVGDAFLARARELGAEAGGLAGKQHAEALLPLLNEGQIKLPTEYYYVFPATTEERDPIGNLYVPCLFWFGKRWYLDWDWLECHWFQLGLVVRLGK